MIIRHHNRLIFFGFVCYMIGFTKVVVMAAHYYVHCGINSALLIELYMFFVFVREWNGSDGVSCSWISEMLNIARHNQGFDLRFIPLAKKHVNVFALKRDVAVQYSRKCCCPRLFDKFSNPAWKVKFPG